MVALDPQEIKRLFGREEFIVDQKGAMPKPFTLKVEILLFILHIVIKKNIAFGNFKVTNIVRPLPK